MRGWTGALVLGLGLALASGSALGSEDDEKGRLVFKKCAACHSLDPAKNKIGPSLHGVIGRKAGSLEAFKFSKPMVDSGITWDATSLESFLADPRGFVPGNRMTFVGLKSEADRKALIAYLSETAPAIAETKSAETLVEASLELEKTAPLTYTADVKYALKTGIADGRIVYIGVGGEIDGKVNPPLHAREGEVVQITLINGEGAAHDIAFPDQNVTSESVVGVGASTTIAFRASKAGTFPYLCATPGHRDSGMAGELVVAAKAAEVAAVEGIDISMDPAAVPPPIAPRAPELIRVDLETVELEGRLADGTTYTYWTFNRTVPGPFLRARVGDTIEVHLKNDPDSAMIHSVDFHATTGPGGGAAVLQVPPGEVKSLRFKLLAPGLYVYHCATPMVAHHIANGMYGLILVEPEGGMAKVDREYYIMQGEIYTDAAFGQQGSQEFSAEKLLNETPEYFVFNGAVGALSKAHVMKAKVGETVRLYVGVGGPNFTSSFHVIGEIFDRTYDLASLTTPPLEGVQTVLVPAGGAAMVEFKLDVPGRYILVDHALSRLERGLVGFLIAEGPDNKEVFEPLSPVGDGGGH